MKEAFNPTAQIADLIRADKPDDVAAAMAAFTDITWADWFKLCRVTFEHQDRTSLPLAGCTNDLLGAGRG